MNVREKLGFFMATQQATILENPWPVLARLNDFKVVVSDLVHEVTSEVKYLFAIAMVLDTSTF